jgi:hypothetical protein
MAAEQGEVKLTWSEFNKGAGKMMANLLSDSNFCDVTLVCDDDKQIKAHKAINKNKNKNIDPKPSSASSSVS